MTATMTATLLVRSRTEGTSRTTMEILERDVVVVGAGVTGLTAATRLAAAGMSVVVLEARERIGGRLWTDVVDGQMREIGGQWVSPDQTALLETLDELGLETYSRYRDGESLYITRDGELRRFTGDIFPAGERTEQEITRLIEVLDGLTAEVDPAAPWAHPRASELDQISFRGWLEQQTDDDEARENIALFVAEAMLTKPAHTFSLLQALLMAASAGGFSNLVDADFILDKRVVGASSRCRSAWPSGWVPTRSGWAPRCGRSSGTSPAPRSPARASGCGHGTSWSRCRPTSTTASATCRRCRACASSCSSTSPSAW
jgi:hypothetical protein